MERKSTHLVQTIQRVAQLIDILSQNPKGMSIRDIFNKVNLPKGTIHRLLSSLLHFGYVRQDSKTRNYFLGFKLVELGNLILNQLDIRKEAEPFLHELAEKTNETVHMVVMDQDEVVYIDKVEMDRNPSGLRMASRIGLRNPPHSCAVGKVLLANLPEESLDSLLKRMTLTKRTENTITDPIQLKEHLKIVREQGYAIDDEENEKGIRCVAAPVRNDSGKVIAAISISGPAFRMTRKIIQEKLKKDVIKTALKISEKLGFKWESIKKGMKFFETR